LNEIKRCSAAQRPISLSTSNECCCIKKNLVSQQALIGVKKVQRHPTEKQLLVAILQVRNWVRAEQSRAEQSTERNVSDAFEIKTSLSFIYCLLKTLHLASESSN